MAEKKASRGKATKKERPAKAAQASRAHAGPPLHDLLDEPLVTVREGSERRLRNLPEVMALLGAKRVDAFPALQAFQQHAWHAFLVQLAAMALVRADESSPKQSSARWKELLLELTDGEREPWCLAVGDLAKPAFLQPPVPERSLADFKNVVTRPDLIDVLVLAKNHDVKMGRTSQPEPEHWLFALVSLQTMQGVLGAGNYGIARMNGGYGSRPGVGLAPRLEPGPRFVRDVRRLLAGRDAVLERHEHYDSEGGRTLLWVEPWDGTRGARVASLKRLDPYFIEVCRRVRLVLDPVAQRPVAYLRATEGMRLAAKDLHGVMGDPWTPVNVAEETAFTASAQGFSYQVVQRILSPEVEPGLALEPDKEDKDLLLVAEVMARGQGQTNGYHHRAIPIPARSVRRLATADERKALAETAKERVEAAAKVRTGVLLPALLTLVQGDPEKPRKLNFKDERPRPWLAAFEGAVDAQFFERLWPDLERPPAEGRHGWERFLLETARDQLSRAIAAGQIPSARRYRAIAGSERMFEICQRKSFPHLFDQQGAGS